MAETGSYRLGSLRPNRNEGGRVALALAISLFAHLLLFSGYELSREIPALRRLLWQTAHKQPVVQIQKTEEPLEFVTVQTPATEAPKNAKYVSNKNTVAADDSQNRALENPQLNGHQTDAPQTVDITHPRFTKSDSNSEQQQPPKDNQNSTPLSKPAENSGDLTLGKPDQTQQEQPRPRTLREAEAELAKRLPSMTMKQEGGAARHARMPSFDVKVTGFGDYDERFAEAVQQNWYNLLDSQKFSLDRTGKVVLTFRLNYDGTISQMQFAENSVGDLLGYVCEKAVLDGAPYEAWTEDMRLKLGDHIDVTYIFSYY
ncbi:MAG TPA: hypothetical protein VMH87_20485 [Pseudomonadales bacterium]|nr:hypothetical protein [Pseudomonadales bacterium]